MTDEGVNSVENRCKGPILLSQSSTLNSHSSDAIEVKGRDFLPVTAAPDPAFRWGCVATGGGEGEASCWSGGSVRGDRVKRREG